MFKNSKKHDFLYQYKQEFLFHLCMWLMDRTTHTISAQPFWLYAVMFVSLGRADLLGGYFLLKEQLMSVFCLRQFITNSHAVPDREEKAFLHDINSLT